MREAFILVQKVAAGVKLQYRASRRRGNESPETIQTTSQGRTGRVGGAKNNIHVSAGIKAGPQNNTKQCRADGNKLFDLENVILTQLGDVRRGNILKITF